MQFRRTDVNQLGKLARAGAIVFGVVMLFGVFVQSVDAQAALPFKAFGSGLTPGSVITAWNGTANVGTATVDANGNWQIQIEPTAAASGDVIAFKIDGKAAAQTVVFQPGLFTPPPGLALTLAAAGPTPAPTGNAGLAGVTPGTPLALMLLMALGAVALTMGGRRATRTH
jgi:hypothetical protein